MKNLEEAYENLKLSMAKFEKEMTMYRGVRVPEGEDGNTTNTEYGQQSYPKKDFENLSKEQIFKQKLMTMKDK